MVLSLDMNAGDATVLGLEASFALAFTDHLTGTLGFSLTDSEFDEARIESFDDFPSFAPDGDVSGNEVLRQSAVQAECHAHLPLRISRRTRIGMCVVTCCIRQPVAGGAQPGGSARPYLRESTLGNRFGTLHSGTVDGESVRRRQTCGRIPRHIFANDLPGGAGGGFNAFFPFRITLSHPRRRQVGVTARFRF